MSASAAPFERYQLQAPLGRGGQGRTYQALDRETHQQVAVKVIRFGEGVGWKAFDLFERECRVLRNLDHPGIPKYLDAFSDEARGVFYLVMELIHGTSLEQCRANQSLLVEPQLWNILHQALTILNYLHHLQPPVIHRDLKPANFIQRSDASLTLVDFGGVRVALREEGGSTVVGTFGYMAPEQLHGEATSATDLYGLAATVAALATGVEADKLPRNGLAIDLTRVMPPSRLRNILQQMLEPDPCNRLATVSCVRKALQASPAGPGTQSSSSQSAFGKGSPSDQSANPTATDPGNGADSTDDETPLKGMPPPLRMLMRLLGTAGYIGIVMIDAFVLPLIFAVLKAVWAPQPAKLAKLMARQKTIRRGIRGGRRAMKALAKGRDPYRPFERGRARQLPSSPTNRSSSPPHVFPRRRHHRGRKR